MSAFAHRVRPPLAALVAVVGLTLAMSPERTHRDTPPAPRIAVVADEVTFDDVVTPADVRDARPWNHGGMVMSPHTRDPIAFNALTSLLSGLFRALGSLAA